MSRRMSPLDPTTGELRRVHCTRIAERLANRAASGYEPVRYADLAHWVGLPWVWNQNNAATIVTLRAALARLERARVISVRPLGHDAVRVRVLREGVDA